MTVGTRTYYNVVCTVKQLVSVGGLSGADRYADAELSIPRVRVGGTVYTDVVVTVGGVVSTGGGLPAAAWDSYDPATGRLTLAAIDVGGRIYTHAVVTLGRLVSGGATGYVGYAYATSSSAVAQYQVGLDGQLAALTPPAVTLAGGSLQGLAADSTGHFVYVTDSSSGAIYQYRISAGGALVPLSPGFVTPAFTPGLIIANPQGPYLYAAAGASGIYQYRIGAAGELTPMTSPLAGGDAVEYSLGINPLGTYLLVSSSSFGDAALSVHPISATGVVGQPTIYPTGSQGIAVAADAAASQIYQLTDDGILQFSGDGQGDFSPGVGASTPGNSSLSGAVLDPSDRFLYVTGAVISQYVLGAGGVPQPLSPATVAAGSGATAMAFDPTGRFAYVATLDNKVLEFALGSGGALEPLNPATAPGAAPAQALIVVPIPTTAP